MGDGNFERNLFGDPVVARREGRGRPEHVWTRENSNKVLLAFVRGLTVKDAATAIGVSVPTLRKVYFVELEDRRAARLRFEITQLARLNDQAEGGNVAAEKELFKRIDKARLEDLSDRVAHSPKPPKPEKIGKKLAQKEAALAVKGRFEPPSPPPDMLN